MAGTISLTQGDAEGVALLTLAHPAKMNAIDIAMWRELQAMMLHLQAMAPADAPHAVIVRGLVDPHAAVELLETFARTIGHLECAEDITRPIMGMGAASVRHTRAAQCPKRDQR